MCILRKCQEKSNWFLHICNTSKGCIWRYYRDPGRTVLEKRVRLRTHCGWWGAGKRINGEAGRREVVWDSV